MKKYHLILALLSFIFSCKKDTPYKSRVVAVDSFNQVQLKNPFNVFIKEGNSYSIEIVGDENFIQDVDLKIENNTLSIENKRKGRWRTPRRNNIKVYITAPPLKTIEATDGSSIQTLSPITSAEFGLILKGKANEANLELAGNVFYYWNSFPAGGKLTLTGKTEVLKIWNFAIMSVDAKNLIAKEAIVENHSKGDCEVTVLNKLEYSIRGEGNIQLYGKPLEIIGNNVSSSGQLIQH